MSDDASLWRNLKVGDRVRLIAFPVEMTGLHRETKQAYRYLLKRRRPLVIYKVDSDGLPWVKFRRRNSSGRIEHHWLALNHSGVARVGKSARS